MYRGFNTHGIPFSFDSDSTINTVVRANINRNNFMIFNGELYRDAIAQID